MNRKELESLKIMELRTYAREHDVSLRRNWSKSEIIAAIVRVTRPKRGRKPKPSARVAVTLKGAPPLTGRKKAAAGKRKAVKARPEPEPSGKPGKGNAGSSSGGYNGAGPGSITLMAQDAATLFLYWDVSGAGGKAAAALDGGRLRIRLWDMAKSETADCYDMAASDLTGSRYVKIGLPDHLFACEIGIHTGNGRFVKLATSSAVRTPPDRMASMPAGSEKFYEENFGLEPGEKVKLKNLTFVFSDS